MAEKELTLESSITEIKGVGKKLSAKLAKVEIKNIEDLFYHFPNRYVDTSEILTISELFGAGSGTILLEITSVKMYYTPKKHMPIVEAVGTDEENFLTLKWFNQKYLKRVIKEGEEYLFYGKLDHKYGKYFMSSPRFEKVKSQDPKKLVHLGRITPVYGEISGISSKRLRSWFSQVKHSVDKIKDPLDISIREKYELLSLSDALKKLHFPKTMDEVEEAKERLAFSELYGIQKKVKKFRDKRKKLKSVAISPSKGIKYLSEHFPFELTKDQKQSVEEILDDLQNDYPMQRLLCGDVGSGKTIVALYAMVTALDNNKSVFFMVPTTILASQHYLRMQQLLPKYKDSIKLVTGNLKEGLTSDGELEDNKNGRLYVGTHALLHLEEYPENVGLVVIDEQHRFGVKQRGQIAYVKDKKDRVPHYLIMSATPIPRTLALSVFGNLDVSNILEKPEGRQPIKTRFLQTETQKDKAYDYIKKRIVKSKEEEELEQLIVVCPLIEESEKLTSQSAVETYKELKDGFFKDLDITLVHGSLKEEVKQKRLTDFSRGEIDILVATPVIEVGVDIPGATMMIIKSAQRFGLAQLHQLRGRIARRKKKGYCFVFSDKDNDEVVERLKFFAKNNNGLKIADYDLKRRGPGEVYGVKQSGLPDLHFASLFDLDLMEKARDAAMG
jgi:ATP-dependent DNA helicase RecG